MMKVSVIIPVYNAEGKITLCLESLRLQTIDGLELVLVDDHGSDNSMQVARDYAGAHPEMHFVFVDNGKNLGPGAARNNGLAHASGQFVAFVDSDDWVSPDFCQTLFDAAQSNQAQMAYCHVSFDYPDGSNENKYNPIVPNGQFDRKSFLRKYKSYFCTFIYERQFLIDFEITFPATHSAEDSCFLLCALLSCQRMASVDKAMYHYMIEPTSVSQKKDPQRWKNRLHSFNAVRRYTKAHGLYKDNWLLIEWLCFKKGFLLALYDIFVNL